ncbi:hypothetical protein GQ53DRAFT_802337 [Thozetella sp. PMI_491]|nr:hypothetical protein GQ53DRAFT_802337 [Thozetella sp. PMI_491]
MHPANINANFLVLSSDGQGMRVREHRRRRQHTKDKLGCTPCKQKRVKCDQRLPTCLRCSRNQRECVYEEVPPTNEDLPASDPSSSAHVPDEPPSGSSVPPDPLSVVQPSPSALVTALADSGASALSPWVKQNGTSVSNLLHHFSNNSATIMGQPIDPQLWELACRYEFMVSTMLAVSACHLRHYTVDGSRHRIAELGQMSAAIAKLTSALTLPLQKERADALLCTAVMLNAVTFASVVSHSVATSWVFDDSADRLGWLDLQLRFTKLEDATSEFREQSLLQPILDAGESKGPEAEGGEAEKAKQLPDTWKMLIGSEDDPNYSLYREPVMILAELRVAEPNCPNSFAYIGLVKKWDERFRDLVFVKDLRALWIVGYWLGLIGRLGIWWCARRVERDWTAVLRLLEDKKMDQQPGSEGRMWKALMADLRVASKWPPPAPEDGSF